MFTFIEVLNLCRKYMSKVEVMKADKRSDNVQAKGSFSNDKWNPVIYGCQLMAQQNIH